MKYEKLFAEGKIGNLAIKNRVVMTAVGVSLSNLDGSPSEEMIAFYEKRAKGGVGLIINEYTSVDDESGVAAVRQLSLAKDETIPQFKKMTDAVHAHGTKMFAQLHHAGRETFNALNGFKPNPTASVKACGLMLQATRSMSVEEIHAMQQKFIDAAKRAEKAGYDGVELHSAHGYLIQQFLSPYTNLRTDEYGGSFENRLRFISEIITGIKKELPNFTLSVRLTADEFLQAVGNPDKGIELEDGVAIAKELEKLGVDIINISDGLYETANAVIEPMSYPQGWRSYLVKAVKDAVSVPVMGVAVIRDPEFAEKLLQDGNQDFITMGRTFLADPEWACKAESGKEAQIRKCISCLHCFETYLGCQLSGEPVQCALDATTAHETKYTDLKQDGAGKVVAVIGAGPAGMESARVLALRGFKPVVFEKEAEVGGQLQTASKPPLKDKITWLVDNQKAQLSELGVEIKYNTLATVDEVKKLSPVGVVVATGNTPNIPTRIAGYDKEHVVIPKDILEGKVEVKGKKVAVIGSGLVGLETAEFLAEQGKEITIFEMQPVIGPGAYAQNLLDIQLRLAKHNVKYLPFHTLLEIKDDEIVTKNEASLAIENYSADSVVLSLGANPEKEIADTFEGKFDKVVRVGDCAKVGRIANAIRTGYDAGFNF